MDLLKVVRDYWEKLKIFMGIILFFVGFYLWTSYPENLLFSEFISPFGQFIAAVASVQLIYEILFRNRDREIFFIEMSKLWEDKIPSIIHCSPEFYEGRRNPSEKIEFYRRARYEVIEIAATLHALSFYYESIAGKEYSDHVKDLLRNGVNIKLFLLDPDSVFAKTYNESTEEECKWRDQNAQMWRNKNAHFNHINPLFFSPFRRGGSALVAAAPSGGNYHL